MFPFDGSDVVLRPPRAPCPIGSRCRPTACGAGSSNRCLLSFDRSKVTVRAELRGLLVVSDAAEDVGLSGEAGAAVAGSTVPGLKFVVPDQRRTSPHAAEDVGEPSLRVDNVEPGGSDQGVHRNHLRGPRRGPLGLKLMELEFEPVEQALLALRASPVELAPELPDPQPEACERRHGVGHLRGGVACLGLG